MTSEEKILKSIREKRDEGAVFFSNKGKSAREKWIVDSFLSKIGVDFNESEVKKESDNSKIDINFETLIFKSKK
ncbi:MAG: hypothetical protein ABJR05_10750 [Balneola sp.]